MFSDKAAASEARLVREHRAELEELHKEINERDAKFEECVEHFQQKLDVRTPNSPLPLPSLPPLFLSRPPPYSSDPKFLPHAWLCLASLILSKLVAKIFYWLFHVLFLRI